MSAAPQTLRVVVDGGAPVLETLDAGGGDRATFADVRAALRARYPTSFIRLSSAGNCTELGDEAHIAGLPTAERAAAGVETDEDARARRVLVTFNAAGGAPAAEGVKLWAVEGVFGALNAVHSARKESSPAWPYLRGLADAEARVWTPAFSGAALTVQVCVTDPVSGEDQTASIAVTPGMTGAELEAAAAALLPALEPGAGLITSLLGACPRPTLDPRLSLAEQGVLPGATLRAYSAWRGEIFVKTLMGKTVTILAHSSDTIAGVKAKARDQQRFFFARIAPDDQRLVFKGKQLDDDGRLGAYGIIERSTLCLICMPPGRTYSSWRGQIFVKNLTGKTHARAAVGAADRERGECGVQRAGRGGGHDARLAEAGGEEAPAAEVLEERGAARPRGRRAAALGLGLLLDGVCKRRGMGG